MAFIFRATEKGKLVFRHKRNFVMSAAVMMCPSPSVTNAYVKKSREAAQKRYAEKDDDHRMQKAATKALHTAHPSVVGRDGAMAGSSAARAFSTPSYAATDMDNLMAVASRQDEVTAATHAKKRTSCELLLLTAGRNSRPQAPRLGLRLTTLVA